MTEKIALLVDSGCDLPVEYLSRDNVFCAPLRVLYKDKEYTDGVDIGLQDILDRLPVEVPTTSLPSGQDILAILDEIKAKGYTHLIGVTISANLSGTHNMFKLMTESYDGLISHVVNTKNIGVVAGLFGVDACECFDRGMSFQTIIRRLEDRVAHCKIFFAIDTLEYLQKGGRIGRVSAILGTALNLKPVISCDKDGIYYTVKKARGRKQSLKQLVQSAIQTLGDQQDYYFASSHTGDSTAEMAQVEASIMAALPAPKKRFSVPVSPALAIHTGPGLIGIGVYPLP